MIKAFLLVVFTLFIIGCVSSPDYPIEWVGISDSTGCPIINGRYRDVGVSHRGHETSLSRFLFGADVGEVDAVQVISNKNKISIKAFKNNLLVMQHAGSSTDVSCNHKYIEIPMPDSPGGVNSGGAIGLDWASVRFSVNDSKELILRYTSGGFGLMFFIPVAGSTSTWMKFFETKH